jgi:U4/U6.U5 tri-snRNP-associated protein 3
MAGMKDITDEKNGENETHDRRREVVPFPFLSDCLDERDRYDRDHDRERDRDYDRDRKAAPSHSRPELDKPHDRRPPPPKPPQPSTKEPEKLKHITAASLLDEDDPPISKLMGFGRFSSTKGKKHEDYGGVDLVKQRTYRQYMNRPGGFNRPLD